MRLCPVCRKWTRSWKCEHCGFQPLADDPALRARENRTDRNLADRERAWELWNAAKPVPDRLKHFIEEEGRDARPTR